MIYLNHRCAKRCVRECTWGGLKRYNLELYTGFYKTSLEPGWRGRFVLIVKASSPILSIRVAGIGLAACILIIVIGGFPMTSGHAGRDTRHTSPEQMSNKIIVGKHWGRTLARFVWNLEALSATRNPSRRRPLGFE